MKPARRIPDVEDKEHKERITRRPAQGWSKKRGSSKRSKPTFKGSAGERYFQIKKSTMGRVSEKDQAGSCHEVTSTRSPNKRRTQAGDHQKDLYSAERQHENLPIAPRYELGVQGFNGYRRGGQNQTWNVSKIPQGTTDLSRKKYSVNWLCQRGYSNIVQNYILELPETLSKLRLSPKSQTRRYPFDPSQTLPSVRTARRMSYHCQEIVGNLEMDLEFDSDNKQHSEIFSTMSTSTGGTSKLKLANDVDTEMNENLAKSDSKHPWIKNNASKNVSADAARPLRVVEAKPPFGIHQSMSRMSKPSQHHNKDKYGIRSSTTSKDGRKAFRALKLDDVMYDPGVHSAAGPISRPQPHGQVKERDKAHRFTNSTWEGEEREWLRQIFNEKLRKYSVKPDKLTIVSKTISASLATDLIQLGYVSVPSPKQNVKGLTKTDRAVLSVQHEIRKIYNGAKLQAKKNASKYRALHLQR